MLGMLGVCMLLGGCPDGRPAAERVAAFCASAKGEDIKAVISRYEAYEMQPGGVAPDARQRLSELVDDKTLKTIASALAEPSGSEPGARAVCAIYYSSRELGGDGRVILAEFRPDWPHRY
ncbi:MAG TPA: hypothetical protein VM489_04810 [Burkholderiales bacterium]|nr:hypothetical protein [Burkholderiales bacterium]